MSTEFNLISEMHDKTLVIKTEGYINNAGGEKIVQELEKHTGVNKLVLNLEKSKVVNSIGISHLIEVIEKVFSIVGSRLVNTSLPLVWFNFSIISIRCEIPIEFTTLEFSRLSISLLTSECFSNSRTIFSPPWLLIYPSVLITNVLSCISEVKLNSVLIKVLRLN